MGIPPLVRGQITVNQGLVSVVIIPAAGRAGPGRELDHVRTPERVSLVLRSGHAGTV